MSFLTDYRSPWMTDELDSLAELTRKFFAKESVPYFEKWAENQQVDRELWTKAGQAGLLCLSVPEEYGGGGGSFAHEAVVQYEQAFLGDSAFGNFVHSGIVAPYFTNYASEEQKQRWLPKLASGEFVGAIAMTEPGTGSDLQSIKTTAKRDGDEYVINGSKTFITNGSHADLIIVVCRTGEEGHAGISLVVVETEGLEGFSRGRVLSKIGMKGQDTRELFFQDVRVPAENILGEEGMGFIYLMQQLPQERLSIAVGAIAATEAAIQQTIDYTKQREAFGRPVFKFQNTRFELAECTTEAMAVRTFVDHCIQRHVTGELDPATASAVKYLATDKQVEIIDRCLQLFGGYGYMLEYPIARAYADARVQKIYGGTNEIMKELISRDL
ncbi:acyl-CoA dehydrogenase family protein [Corynebacterium resistens]